MSKNIKIVVVEDDVAIKELYELKLKIEGFDVRTAENGVHGMKVTEEFKPDLILLDLMMPEMTGDEMLEHLRATDWGSRIRVIILTNISRDEAPIKLRLLNVDRYIVKAHYTPAQVVKVVEEVLQAQRSNK